MGRKAAKLSWLALGTHRSSVGPRTCPERGIVGCVFLPARPIRDEGEEFALEVFPRYRLPNLM